MAPSAACLASMRSLYCQGTIREDSVMDRVAGRTKVAGAAARGRRNEVGEGRGGWGMIPFKPRACGAGERERVKVRRLSVPVRPLALEPSELDARGGGGGLGTRGGFRVSPPPLRASTLMEPRLPMTVCESSSVSSSSVLKPDPELSKWRQQQYQSPFHSQPSDINDPLSTKFLGDGRARDRKMRSNVTGGKETHLEEPA
jgi:hypothetical protein